MGLIRVRVLPPPMKAPHLWSTAAERDELVGMRSSVLALPWSCAGCPLLSDALPNGEDWVSPRVSKLACCPALTSG